MSNKIQRNFKCPCGSGKKFKHCCEPKPEKIEPRPAAAGGVDFPESKVKGSAAPKTATPLSVGTTFPNVRVRGAFGQRKRHPIRQQIPTDPKFLSRAARERLHVSHT